VSRSRVPGLRFGSSVYLLVQDLLEEHGHLVDPFWDIDPDSLDLYPEDVW
jgi:hypothetical protein